jgi:collagenase-like PrtC family protease
MKARFHLPGIATHFKFNLIFATVLEQYPQYFRDFEIASFYGAFPQSIWNGGRTQEGLCDKRFVKMVLKEFNDRGIPVRFTFTNPALEKKHLNDKFCNMVMSLADNGLNEAIVVSPILEEYIRKNFPNFKLTSSTCKRLDDGERLAAELEKDYSIVVVDYDLNNKFDILEKLPHKEKCEFLVNSNCRPACPNRKQHYYNVGVQQINYANHMRKYPDKPYDPIIFGDGANQNCPFFTRNLFEIRDLSTNIKPADIWDKYLPMGFNQFKIEGRTAWLFNLIETYVYYLAKPEFADIARYTLIDFCNENDVLSVNE